MTAAPPGKTIMGSVQTFGGQSKAGANRPVNFSWSSDEPPSVALPAFDAGSAAAEHDRTQVLRSPAKWHTSCPPLSIFFILGAVSPADDSVLPVGEGTRTAPERLSAVARSDRRFFGMRRNPPTSSRSWILAYSVKKGMLRTDPQRPFFKKGLLRACKASLMYVSTPLAARPGVATKSNKKTAHRQEPSAV